MPGKVTGVNMSVRKGTSKTNVGSGFLVAGWGLQGDAHAGTHRQLSLFPAERARELTAGRDIEVRPGDLAENITVSGLDWGAVKPGARLSIGQAVCEVVRIGKPGGPAHTFSFHGMAPLLAEGIYCRVVRSGAVKEGDEVGLL